MEEIGESVDMQGGSPPMGPYSFIDTFGMSLAVCILLHSLDAGQTKDNIQFSTARFLMSAFSNLYHAFSQHETGKVVLAQGTTKIFVTNCPSYSYWFECFMQGVHKRMGKELQLDYALSITILQKILGSLNHRWGEVTAQAKCKEVVEIAFFLVITLCL